MLRRQLRRILKLSGPFSGAIEFGDFLFCRKREQEDEREAEFEEHSVNYKNPGNELSLLRLGEQKLDDGD